LSDNKVDVEAEREASEAWNTTRDGVDLNGQRIALETWRVAWE